MTGLENHMWIHAKTAGDKRPQPHVCHMCGEKFIFRFKLKNHLASHVNPLPFASPAKNHILLSQGGFQKG